VRDAATLAMLADTSDLDDLLRSQLKGLRPVGPQMVVVPDRHDFKRQKKKPEERGGESCPRTPPPDLREGSHHHDPNLRFRNTPRMRAVTPGAWPIDRLAPSPLRLDPKPLDC